MRRNLTVLVFLLAVFVGFGLSLTAQPGPPRTYTATWTHDGTAAVADSFEIVLDGAVAVTVPNADPACTGTVAARACTSPLTMTTNVPHTIYVRAVNLFGQAMSDPFSAAPPSRPAGVVIR
jgi:hypothetical protein